MPFFIDFLIENYVLGMDDFCCEPIAVVFCYNVATWHVTFGLGRIRLSSYTVASRHSRKVSAPVCIQIGSVHQTVPPFEQQEAPSQRQFTKLHLRVESVILSQEMNI